MIILPVKLALAEPGRPYQSNRPTHQPHLALDYAGRDIGPALPLFRAIRDHLAQLMAHFPDAWDRALVLTEPAGRRVTAGEYISAMARHGLEHVEEITAIRRLHNR